MSCKPPYHPTPAIQPSEPASSTTTVHFTPPVPPPRISPRQSLRPPPPYISSRQSQPCRPVHTVTLSWCRFGAPSVQGQPAVAGRVRWRNSAASRRYGPAGTWLRLLTHRPPPPLWRFCRPPAARLSGGRLTPLVACPRVSLRNSRRRALAGRCGRRRRPHDPCRRHHSLQKKTRRSSN